MPPGEKGGGRWRLPSWLPWRPRSRHEGDRLVRFPPLQMQGHGVLRRASSSGGHPHPGEAGAPVPRPRKYAGNRTTTTKYSLLTFIPKSLFEQYRRVANIYFTLVAALSLTDYSPVRPWTTFLPLGIVLGVAMIKEAVEDYKRHRQDVEVNNRSVEVYNPASKGFDTRTWKDVRVGDVIIVHKDEYFPADLLFLTAENEEGICYIETMQLDGETNLKIKKALDETKDLRQATIARFAGCVHCEAPNSRLYQFTGNLEAQPPLLDAPGVLPLSPTAILLRGCSLRNTHRVFGLVIYAGHDTKIFKNSTQPPSKRSCVERVVDRIIMFMFGLLFSMCLTGCIYFAWWTHNEMPRHWYLAPTRVPREYDSQQPGVVAITNFITSFILYGYLIPIALYVSIEMVKIVQSLCFIGLDRSMYHEDTDTPAVARTSNLNEELGMVNTILSDKTGTLTRNVMEFFKASIGGVAYGAGITEIERNNAERRGLKLDVPDEEADNKYREPYFNFYDARLMGLDWARQPNPELTAQFFRLLALCHTVIPDGPPLPEQIRYEAESPDEAALVVAAKVFGFFMVKRTNTVITLCERLPEGNRETEYEILNILEFNSTRKRMSVIVRTPDDRIILYCKGADTVIYERLDRGHPLNDKLKDVTLQHMEEFGSAGLRTLCLSYTELDPTFYDEWNERFIEAKLSMVDRAAKVDAVGEQVERNLRLLGCTAIEDKLQEGVPQCIKTLAQAGIRLWVLTGDKMETAINIGYACSLITDEMTQFQLTGSCAEVDMLEAEGRLDEATQVSADRLESQLLKVQATIAEDAGAGLGDMSYALIIDGKALLYALSPRLRNLFLEVGLRCAAVLCCRVSPLQKAQVTALVKTKGDTTLAIGDGANDVGMIQKAHIGVGISGQEGMQAAMASDFTIAQFRFLTPLLLVHGRLSYKRITRMICFFFYKNLFYGSTIFVYNAFALFSGQPIYNDFYMTLFNVVFTAAAPLVVGWFDRDLDKAYGLRFPFLYQEGQQNLYFSLPAIVGWLGTALLHAAIVVVMVLTGADSSDSDSFNGHNWSLQRSGVLMFSLVIITVHMQLAMVIDQWMWMHHVAIWGSIVLWFLFLLAYGSLPIKLSTDLYHAFDAVANVPSFWLTLLVVPLTCMLPIFFVRALRRHLRPARYQLVQEIAARERRGETVDAEAALDDDAGEGRNAQLKGIMARASRLVQRKVLRQAQGSRVQGRHKGFVPPYNTQSRVFDTNELRSAATHAGYSISASGDVIAAGPHHGSSAASHGSQAGGSAHPADGRHSSMVSSLLAFGHRHSGSMAAASDGASGGGAGLTLAGRLAPGLGVSSMPPAFAHASLPLEVEPMHPGGVPGQVGSLSAGGGRPGLMRHSYSEILPPVDGGLVTNPVITNLERAFNQDPRRHRRNDSHLSSLSISSLHRMRPSSAGSASSRRSSDPGGSSPVRGAGGSPARASSPPCSGMGLGLLDSPGQPETPAAAAGGSAGGSSRESFFLPTGPPPGGQRSSSDEQGISRGAASLHAGEQQQQQHLSSSLSVEPGGGQQHHQQQQHHTQQAAPSRLGRLPQQAPVQPAASPAAAGAGSSSAGAAGSSLDVEAGSGSGAAATAAGEHEDAEMLSLYTAALQRRTREPSPGSPGKQRRQQQQQGRKRS